VRKERQDGEENKGSEVEVGKKKSLISGVEPI
jgi:hypothetical protein